jgi:hypothetical protein
MNTIECAREQDVLDALAARRWPARSDAGLVAHVAQCSICSDMVAVIQPLTEAEEELWPTIQVPSAATVWWRAQLRARQEAARRASRPMTIVHAAASIAALAVMVSVLYVAGPWVRTFSFSLPALPSIPFTLPEMSSIRELGPWARVAIGMLITWGIVAPIAIYFATAEE